MILKSTTTKKNEWNESKENKDLILHIWLQSGRLTKREFKLSSLPKNISCTTCLLHIRHCVGHGSPQIPIPLIKLLSNSE